MVTQESMWNAVKDLSDEEKQAAQKLADMGYTNVYEFGGINTWDGDVVR